MKIDRLTRLGRVVKYALLTTFLTVICRATPVVWVFPNESCDYGSTIAVRYSTAWGSGTWYWTLYAKRPDGVEFAVAASPTSSDVWDEYAYVTADQAGVWEFRMEAWDDDGSGRVYGSGGIKYGSTTVNAVSQQNHPPETISAGGVNVSVNQPTTLTGRATDPDGNLSLISFYVSGPGLPGWNHVANVSASGGDATVSTTWTPSQTGTYNVHIRTQDTSGAWDWNANVVGSFTANSAQSLNFKIMVSTNQMNFNEATDTIQSGSLASDGVWSMPYNSTIPNPQNAYAVYPQIPYGSWPGIMASLNAGSWAVSEDLYGDWGMTDWTQDFIGHRVNAQMVYQENNSAPNHTVLTSAQISEAAIARGNTIIVLARAYEVTEEMWYIDDALMQPACSGIVFEGNPDSIGHGFNEGINYCLNSAQKKCYVLLPPSSNTMNYMADVQHAMSYLAESRQLGNPNLHIVLAAYDRTQAGVPFINFSNRNDPNSVLAALNWLKAYRGN